MVVGVLVQSSTANATTGYPVNMGVSAGGTVAVAANGNPVVKDCDVYQNIKSYSATNGALVYQKNAPSSGMVDFCERTSPDSFINGGSYNLSTSGIVVARGNSNASAGFYNRIQGYTGSVVTWTYTAKNECNQTAAIVAGPVVNGNVVAIAVNSCNANGGYAMRQLNANTGAVIGSPLYIAGYWEYPGIKMYNNGFILAGPNGIQFVNFSNTIDSSKTIYIGPRDVLGYSPQGDVVYQEVTSEPEWCNVNFRSISTAVVSNNMLCNDVPTGLGGVLPNGDLVGQKLVAGGFDFANPTLRILHKGGSLNYTDIPMPVSSNVANDSFRVANTQIDSLGNIIVGSSYDDINGTTQSLVDIFGSDGLHKGRWSSKSLPDSDTKRFVSMNQGYALGNGVIYVDDFENKRLVSINSPSTRMSYQDTIRWGIAVAAPIAERQYIALGDSYSSGQGNPIYEAGTDVAGVNECRRSLEAYPQVVADDISKNINLLSFKACGGATTNDVLGLAESDDPKGSWFFASQKSVLVANPDVDIVSITVGGNDAGFQDYASACWVGWCDFGSIPYNNIVGVINSSVYRAKLESTYKALLDSTNHAQVYILDYPTLVVNDSNDACVAFNTPYNVTDESNDITVAYVGQLLNATIEEVYLSVKTDPGYSTKASRLHLVKVNYPGSPFDGHDFCSDRYLPLEEKMFYPINEPTFWDVPEALHPTVKGQYAYAQILLNAIG